jgi:hypothetical protein
VATPDKNNEDGYLRPCQLYNAMMLVSNLPISYGILGKGNVTSGKGLVIRIILI